MPGVVCKFGGTSIKDLPSLKKVLSILEKDSDRRYVVVSAPGRRFDGDEKVTDLFIKAHEAVGKNDEKTFSKALDDIWERFEPFGCPFVKEELCEIAKKLRRGESLAFAASRGEYLSAKIVSKLLGFPTLKTDECLYIRRGKTLAKSYDSIRSALRYDRAVIPGFYGRNRTEIAVYPRGGGDITGAVIANAVNAERYENWTDVCGVRACSPVFIKKSQRVERLSFAEIRALSLGGATVLHADAVLPLWQKNIPIVIGNTFDDEGEKTIVEKTVFARRGIAGLAVKKRGENYCLTAVDENTNSRLLKNRLMESLKREKIPVLKTERHKIFACAIVSEQELLRAVQIAYHQFF